MCHSHPSVPAPLEKQKSVFRAAEEAIRFSTGVREVRSWQEDQLLGTVGMAMLVKELLLSRWVLSFGLYKLL